MLPDDKRINIPRTPMQIDLSVIDKQDFPALFPDIRITLLDETRRARRERWDGLFADDGAKANRYGNAARYILDQLKAYAEQSPLLRKYKKTEQYLAQTNPQTQIDESQSSTYLEIRYPVSATFLSMDGRNKKKLFHQLCAKAEQLANSPEVADILARDEKLQDAREAQPRDYGDAEPQKDYNERFMRRISDADKREAYAILGVTEHTPWDKIRTAYLGLAKKHHPDNNPGDKETENLFKEAQNAYDLLEKAREVEISR